MLHEPQNLQVLFEDNHLIAVNKPAGLLVQSDHTGAFCLLETVRQYLREQYEKPGDAYVGLLHRLDRPVSGVVLFAKTSKGASRLSDQIRKRTVQKTYHALVEGKPKATSGTLENHLREVAIGHPVEVLDVAIETSKDARLSYRVLETGAQFSLVEIDLHTGRKHQIRAQMAHIGCPIAGDRLYGAKLAFEAPVANALGLVAYSLEFSHPVRPLERVKVTVPVLPREMWQAWL